MANPGNVKKQPAEPVCNPTTVGVGLGSYRPGIYDAPAHPFLVFPFDMPLPDSGHRPPVRGNPRPATSSDESSNKQPVNTKPANGWPSPERSRQLGFGEVRPETPEEWAVARRMQKTIAAIVEQAARDGLERDMRRRSYRDASH